MGIFSIFASKKPIDEIVADYTNSYNQVINSNGSSIDAFKKLAEYSFVEARRLGKTSCTNKVEAYSWFGFDVSSLKGSNGLDRKEIASYIFNAIAMAQKHFWEPVSQQKMDLLHNLIDEKLVSS
jgi:hypothetical protein